jgi:DNA repair exonuclease SbcCD ATPase subunit
MGLFPGAGRQALKPHVHVADELCPWCDQPIPHGKFEEIAQRIEAKEREQHAEVQRRLKAEFAQQTAALEAKARTALEQARAEAAAAVEQKVLAAKAEAARTAEAAMLAKLGEIQSRLAQAEQAKTVAHEQMAALKAEQEAAAEKRVQEREAALRQEKDTAVLAERTKAFEETQALRQKLEDLSRKLEGKSAHELGEGCAMLSSATASSAFPRASTAPT